QSPRPQPITRQNDDPCALAIGCPDSSWCLSALDAGTTNLLDVRRHTQPNRTWLPVPVPAGVAAGARPMDCAGSDHRRLLGRVRVVPNPRRRIRLFGSRRAEGLAWPDDRLCRALE